jgi:hypothetical protein
LWTRLKPDELIEMKVEGKAARESAAAPTLLSTMSLNVAYIPHLVYSLAIASLATHLLANRKEWEAQRAHVSAQISVLESLSTRMRTRPRMDDETQRLLNLVGSDAFSERRTVSKPRMEELNWWGALLGGADAKASVPAASIPAHATVEEREALEWAEGELSLLLVFTSDLHACVSDEGVQGNTMTYTPSPPPQ